MGVGMMDRVPDLPLSPQSEAEPKDRACDSRSQRHTDLTARLALRRDERREFDRAGCQRASRSVSRGRKNAISTPTGFDMLVNQDHGPTGPHKEASPDFAAPPSERQDREPSLPSVEPRWGTKTHFVAPQLQGFGREAAVDKARSSREHFGPRSVTLRSTSPHVCESTRMASKTVACVMCVETGELVIARERKSSSRETTSHWRVEVVPSSFSCRPSSLQRRWSVFVVGVVALFCHY